MSCETCSAAGQRPWLTAISAPLVIPCAKHGKPFGANIDAMMGGEFIPLRRKG